MIIDGRFKGGFVPKDLVTLTGEKFAIVRTEKNEARVRAAPTKDGAVRGILAKGASFAADRNGEWFEIKDGRYRGLHIAAELVSHVANSAAAEAPPSPTPSPSPIPTPALSPTPTPTATPEPVAAPSPAPTASVSSPAPQAAVPVDPVPAAPSGDSVLGTVIAKTPVRLRQAPSTKSPVFGGALPGEILAVERENNEWFEIKSGPYKGKFIAAAFVKLNPAVSPVPVVATAAPSSPAVSVTSNAGTVPGAPAQAVSVQNAPGTEGVGQNTPPATSTPKPDPRRAALEPKPLDEKAEKRFDEQVEKLFKKKGGQTADENQVHMPTYFGARDKLIGQVQTRVQASGGILIDAPVFFRYLRKVIVPSWFDRPEVVALDPEKAPDSKESLARAWLDVNRFANTGIRVTYSDRTLDIIVSVPPELRSPMISSIFHLTDEKDLTASSEKPSFFSSYLNVNAAETIDTRNFMFKDRRSPLRAQLDSGTNFGGFVLEANGRYLENRAGKANPNPEFSRGDVRIVRDFPGSTLRTTVGDLIYPVQGFQSYRPMAGVAVTSNFSMARSKLTYPTGKYELFLQRDSKVYIWVNNQLQKVVDLPAGRHSLRDFPFVSGSNELRFEIVDDVGRQEEQLFNYFSSAELLRPGLHEFSYAIGEPSSEIDGERRYDSALQTLSAFHRYGIGEQLTLGANVQHDKQQTLAGAEALFAMSRGFFKIQPGVSLGGTQGMGLAVNTSYSYSDDKGPGRTTRAINLGVNHANSSFQPFGSLAPGSAKDIEVVGAYSRGLNKNLSANVSGTFGRYGTFSGPRNSFTLRLGFNRRWQDGLNLSTAVSHTRTTSGKEDLGVSAFLIWSFPKEKQVVSAIHNTADKSSRLDWSYNPAEGTDSANYGAAIRDTAGEQGYSVQAAIEGNRARIGLSHEVILTKPGATRNSVVLDPEEKDSNNVTTLLFGTSIAFAGGHVAIGRPVTDSFAIIAPVKNLRGQRLDINPQGEDRYVVKTSFLGPALLPELGSYNVSEIQIGARHLPLNLTLPRDHYSVYPRYKSGYAFEAGTDAVIFLTAKFLGPDETPVALAAGTAIYLDDPDEAPVTIFTNKKGVLRSEGFKPGRYRLEIAAGSFLPIEIKIPESATESFDLGTLKLKAE